MFDTMPQLDRIERKIDQLTTMFYASELTTMLSRIFPENKPRLKPPCNVDDPFQIDMSTEVRYLSVLVASPQDILVKWYWGKEPRYRRVEVPSDAPDGHGLQEELIKVVDELRRVV